MLLFLPPCPLVHVVQLAHNANLDDPYVYPDLSVLFDLTKNKEDAPLRPKVIGTNETWHIDNMQVLTWEVVVAIHLCVDLFIYLFIYL